MDPLVMFLYVILSIVGVVAIYYIGIFIFMVIAMNMLAKTLGGDQDVDK